MKRRRGKGVGGWGDVLFLEILSIVVPASKLGLSSPSFLSGMIEVGE